MNYSACRVVGSEAGLPWFALGSVETMVGEGENIFRAATSLLRNDTKI